MTVITEDALRSDNTLCAVMDTSATFRTIASLMTGEKDNGIARWIKTDAFRKNMYRYSCYCLASQNLIFGTAVAKYDELDDAINYLFTLGSKTLTFFVDRNDKVQYRYESREGIRLGSLELLTDMEKMDKEIERKLEFNNI